MSNRLLAISSSPTKQLLLGDLLSSFKAIRQPFFLITKSKRLRRRGQIERWLIKKSWLPLWPPLLFAIFSPVWWLIFSWSFVWRVWRFKANTVLLINWPEKILFSPLAKLFNLKLIWLEYPERDLTKLPQILKFFYRRFSKHAKIIVFGKKSAEIFQAYVADRDMIVVQPSTLANSPEQHSIFKTLAEQTKRGRFVVGSVLYGLPRDQAERLLSALAIAETVCPTIELVIIGEGKNRRQIQWLAKRMNLSRKVWLAGPTTDFQRWVGQLNVYIMANKKPTLEDSAWAINAMASGLPIIGPKQSWLEDIVNEQTGVLIDINDPEILARQLINWQQETEACDKMGKAAKSLASDLEFTELAKKFIKLLS